MKHKGVIWGAAFSIVWLVGSFPGLCQDMEAAIPFPSSDSVFMEELTWMEVRDAIRGGKTTAIVATGGIEQNGPFVATGKHNYVLRATTAAIARRLGNAIVAPIIGLVPEGNIDPPSGHMRFPGTISLREETFELVLEDVSNSLRQHGFTSIVFIADSGGNQTGMEKVAEKLNREWRGSNAAVYFVREYYEQDKWSFDFLKTIGVHQQPDVQSASRAGIHSDYHYEAIMATVDPELIRTRQRLAIDAYEINGFDMNPSSKTVENGRRMVDYRARITVDAIQAAMQRRSSTP